MTKLISFEGKYTITNGLVGNKTNREIKLQLLTNTKNFGADIPPGSFAKAINNLQIDIESAQSFDLISGSISVVTAKIDDFSPSSESETIEIKSFKDLEEFKNFMVTFRIFAATPAPQTENMEDCKQPLLLSKQHQHDKREEDSNSNGYCAVIKSALRCFV